jgi:hypothetical protein
MTGLDLTAKTRAARLAATIQKLLALDEVLTSAFSSTVAPQDVANIMVVGAEIESSYNYCARELDWLERTVVQNQQALFSQFRTILEHSSLTDAAKRSIEDKLLAKNQILDFLRRAGRELPSLIRDEVQHLSQELARASAGEHVAGDMKPETKCFLKGMVFAACLGLGSIAAVGVGVALLDCF